MCPAGEPDSEVKGGGVAPSLQGLSEVRGATAPLTPTNQKLTPNIALYVDGRWYSRLTGNGSP
jgi:hypothetical protein